MTAKAKGQTVWSRDALIGQKLQPTDVLNPIIFHCDHFWKTAEVSSSFHRWPGLIFHPTEMKFRSLRSPSCPVAHGLLFVAVDLTVFQ